MKLNAIHHVAIIVSDIHAAREFYVEKLGFQVIRENYRDERKDWKLDLKIGDGGEAIELEIFAEVNPPLVEMDFETFYERILCIIDDNNCSIKLDKRTVRNHLKYLQGVLEGKEEIYRAIEWKDGKIYVLDPLFLFYLRWGRMNG